MLRLTLHSRRATIPGTLRHGSTTTLTAQSGSKADSVPVRRALISVSDKTGVLELGKYLHSQGVQILSTGGTAEALRAENVAVTDVAEHTGFPEILGGRVKSLHPAIHGGILAVRGNEAHSQDLSEHAIGQIDMVVANLYPFEQAVSSGCDFETAIENIDIGGPTMMRAAAKNCSSVAVLTNPSQYAKVIEEMKANDGSTTQATRRGLAAAAFSQSAAYESAIADYLSDGDSSSTRFTTVLPLKYGNNPHQQPAALCSLNGDKEMPFKVVQGSPGYINLLDAVNAWQLVNELRTALDLPAAASFKHVSPAGAALGVPLSEVEAQAFDIPQDKADAMTPLACAYIRARNADPLCSFGDFAALSDVVDEATARILKAEVSDGVVAPGYEPAALEILKSKKGGKFIVLQADPNFTPPELERREIFGMGFVQKRSDIVPSPEHVSKIVSKRDVLPEDAMRDLVLGNITIKYTQSNSVGYAKNGMMLGVGAGQQSRVDCVKLAGNKVKTWWLRQHPKLLGLEFKSSVKRQARVNARVRFIEGDMSDIERTAWEENFDQVPEPLTDAEKNEWLTQLDGVGLSSDAFFPFRDGIDHASKFGVEFVSQPGGSVGDPAVTEAADDYGMVMTHSGLRLFHH